MPVGRAAHGASVCRVRRSTSGISARIVVPLPVGLVDRRASRRARRRGRRDRGGRSRVRDPRRRPRRRRRSRPARRLAAGRDTRPTWRARTSRRSSATPRRRSTRPPPRPRRAARRARSSSTGTGARAASVSSAGRRPRSVSTAGWIPRASSRSSSSACASSACAPASSASAASGSLAIRDSTRRSDDGERDEPLLRAVVQVALERAPRRLLGAHEARSRGAQLLRAPLALGDVEAGDEEERALVDAGERRARPRDREAPAGLRHPGVVALGRRLARGDPR